MKISGCNALVTGASGGIGKVFVAELLRRGAAKVYITAREPDALSDLLGDGDNRMIPLELDVTDPVEAAGVAAVADDVTLLINYAGYAAFEGAISANDLKDARTEMEVNYFGPLTVTRAFQAVLAAGGGGTVVNMLSMVALVSLPMAATYSASKAASLSITRSLRAELAAQGTLVVGVIAVQTETEMGVQLPPPRLSPLEVVTDALDAVEAGANEEVFAGALTRSAHAAFLADPIGFQAIISTRLPQGA